MLKFGSHVGFTKSNKYLVGAVKDALSYGATAMMIYLGAPQNTKRASYTEMFLDEYEENYMEDMPKENILVHAPYIINPSSPEKYKFAIEFLIKEIEIMNKLGLKQIVLHPGAYTKFKKEDAISILVKSLKEIISKTKGVKILLETMAGKGTEIGTTFEELNNIIERVNSERIGVCLDTCHIWDAGYDVNNYEEIISKLKATHILDKVWAIHINDSKNVLGAHKDRHANIGQGNIEIESLKKFIFGEEFDDLIKVLETPYVNGVPIYKKEIETLKN